MSGTVQPTPEPQQENHPTERRRLAFLMAEVLTNPGTPFEVVLLDEQGALRRYLVAATELSSEKPRLPSQPMHLRNHQRSAWTLCGEATDKVSSVLCEGERAYTGPTWCTKCSAQRANDLNQAELFPARVEGIPS